MLKLLNHQITNVSDLGQIRDKLDDAQIQKGEIDKRRKQVTKKKEEVQRYDHLRLDLYEDYKNGLIMKEEYLELKQIYEKRTQAAGQVLEAMEVEMAFPAGGQRSTSWISEQQKAFYLAELDE